MSLDKIEMLHRYACRQDADERGVDLDVHRAAVASTVSKPGHNLFMAYRKILEREAKGERGAGDPKKTRRQLRSKLVAMGASPVDKK